MFALSFEKISQLVPQFQTRKRAKERHGDLRRKTVFVLSVVKKETVLLNAGHITNVKNLCYKLTNKTSAEDRQDPNTKTRYNPMISATCVTTLTVTLLFLLLSP